MVDSVKSVHKKQKVGKVHVFNVKALQQAARPIFIVEGELDALSIIDVGGEAIALGSTANSRILIDMLKIQKPSQSLIIAMDNDKAGNKARKELSDGLERLKIPFYSFVSQPYKDANEALNADWQAFEQAVANAERIQEEAEPSKKEKFEVNKMQSNDETRATIENHRAKNLLPMFRESILDVNNNRPISIGYDYFDKAIGGGLFPRLYIIGAISTLGKTTFVLQMADHIAASGTDVLIFSLEMPKEEIIARSISRHTVSVATMKAKEMKADVQLYVDMYAKTELGILNGSLYPQYTDEEKAVIKEAYNAYARNESEHIFIYEGKHTADEIQEFVEQHIHYTGKRPVVVVDYLQIIRPTKDYIRSGTKEQVDYNINALAEIRRYYKVPVIAISSFSRHNYTSEAAASSFKESGNIEYSGDALITLEYDYERSTGKDADNENRKKSLDAARCIPRYIKLTFQKNRGNRCGSRIFFVYDPRYNIFSEDKSRDNIF